MITFIEHFLYSDEQLSKHKGKIKAFLDSSGVKDCTIFITGYNLGEK